MDVNAVNEPDCHTIIQETLRTEQSVTHIQEVRTRHFGHFYREPHHEHPRNTLSHSYDPNMCTTAARFSDSFYNGGSGPTLGAASATELQSTPPPTGAHEEDLLCYNNVILLHETAEIGAEAIVSNTEVLEEAAPGTDHHTQIRVQEETFVSNYQYLQYDQTALQADAHASGQVAGVVVHRSPNGHLYQNYLVNAAGEAKGPVEYVQIQAHHNDVNMFGSHSSAEVGAPTHLNGFELPTQYAFQHEAQVVDENSVELMAQFAADLANVSTVAEHYEPMGRQLAIAQKDQQRLLLESTMSPLLAAVNDITKRDAELQLYLNQHLERDSTISTANFLERDNGTNASYEAKKGEAKSKKESPENSSDEDDYLFVSDKRVECRAKASLPTNYLYFGNVDSNTNEPSVYAKRSIPRRTKFGPYEGDVQFASEIDLDVLHVQTPRYYPLLMVDESHILDVSNEETSNWMRYIRLAQTYAQQNLQILLEDRKVFFRCVRDIRSKEELRVGYHVSYATRFFLPLLQPSEEDLKVDFRRAHPWKCFECDKRFATSAEMKAHLKVHDTEESEREALAKKRRRKRRLSFKNKLTRSPLKRLTKGSNRCGICFKVFMTNEMLKRHVAKQHVEQAAEQREKAKNVVKSAQVKERRYMYKCNLCAKRFHSGDRLETHRATHNGLLEKPHTCPVCQQQCATPAALTAHLHSHSASHYMCVFCEQNFKYVRDFKQHVEGHKSANGRFQCKHCHKYYNAYHLVRKHVRIFHSSRQFACDTCGKKFQNVSILQRHKLTHSQEKQHTCGVCHKEFSRQDHLRTHTKRVHNTNTAKSAPKRSLDKAKGQAKKEEQEKGKAAVQTEKAAATFGKGDDVMSLKSTEPMSAILNDGSQYLKLSPKKPLLSTASSSSNRRKQTPTKLKALELNAETVTYVALSEMLSPFIISDRDLFRKPEKKNEKPEELPEKKTDFPLASLVTDPPAQPTDSREKPDVVEKKNTESETFSTPSSACNPLYPFKCHICSNVFFKRRGVLVNHFAKVHPAVNVEDIEILRAPIVRQQLIFPCPYCSNVYKLNAKRKVHILKHHPGQELPTSMRRYSATAQEAEVATVGTLTVDVHKCNLCHKQYAARSRLVSHYRKAHPKANIPVQCSSSTQCPNLEEFPPIADCYQQKFLEPEINILSYPPPASPENKLLKLSSAALELSRFDFLNERDRCSNDVVGNVFSDHAANSELNRLPQLFEEASIAGIDTSIEKYNRSIEAQFFEKIAKFS